VSLMGKKKQEFWVCNERRQIELGSEGGVPGSFLPRGGGTPWNKFQEGEGRRKPERARVLNACGCINSRRLLGESRINFMVSLSGEEGGGGKGHK